MSALFEEFTNCYPLSKTLRFSLRPIGKTRDFIKERGLLQEDEELSKKYKYAKKIIDEYHKDFIDRKLRDFSFDKKDLKKIFDQYEKHQRCSSSNERKDIEKEIEKSQRISERRLLYALNPINYLGRISLEKSCRSG